MVTAAVVIPGASGGEGMPSTASNAAFPSLPEELIKLIFEYACIASPSRRAHAASADASSASATRNTGPAALDIPTTLSLMLVSRAAHSLIVPILYRSVTISRPSQLMALAATLLPRPSLGLIIRNLWVGSLDSPSMNFLPLIISDVGLAVAAKAHIARFVQEVERTGAITSRKLHHTSTPDIVYVETGVEYAAMHVPPRQDRLVEPLPGGTAEELPLADWETSSVASSTTSISSASTSAGFGVDRASLGYDAAGEWIGMDEWMWRCLELQRAIEFHWEWVGVTCGAPSEANGDGQGAEEDRAARAADPMDWADARDSVASLPSHQRQFSADTMASSSTTEYMRSGASQIGFQHLRHYFTLRQDGHSPQDAARLLIRRYLRNVTPSGQTVADVASVCNIDLLADTREEDHFLHPALFARSGAVHLIVPAEAPEGPNAPPNAIPATAAAASYFHDARRASDDESSDEEESGEARANDAGTANGAAQGLDFVDLFGHIPNSTRTLYAGVRVPSNEGDEMLLSQTLTQELNILRPAKPVKQTRARPRLTIGGLLANLRAILAMCPRIRVLGLNGFLERAVGGHRECAGLPELRHLSLGPPPPFWSSALNLHQSSLASLRTLHISGCMLFRSEAMAIGGFTAALPRLREVDWTLWLGHALEHPINVVEALSYLIGKEVPSPSAPRRSRSDGVCRRKPLRKIRATLNGDDIAFWQRHAGAESADDPRLLLRECVSRETDVNLQAVRRWWEIKAGLI